jgi:hypothetical protein
MSCQLDQVVTRTGFLPLDCSRADRLQPCWFVLADSAIDGPAGSDCLDATAPSCGSDVPWQASLTKSEVLSGASRVQVLRESR